MDDDIASVGQAATAASTAVIEAAGIAEANANATIAAVVENAAEEIDAARETAEHIAQAAMETELGRMIAETNRRISEWLEGEGRRLTETVTAMQQEIASLRETQAATAVLALNSTPSQSTPPLSTEAPLTEALETVTEILPEVVESPVESIPVEPVRKKRGLFL